jgi:hypothetical protein
LWIAQHVFYAKYNALGYIGAVFAIAGAAVLVFLAPFPRIVRWPLAFTYVMVYQYAVIARPYTLFPLLAFCAALFFNDVRHPGRIMVALVLLALLTLHGTILAGCLGFAYLVEAYKRRTELDAMVRRRYIISMVILAVTFLFVVAILKPTPDVGEFAGKRDLAQMSQAQRELRQPGPMRKAEAILCGAFLDFTIPSALCVLLIGWWCYRRKRLLEYALPVVLLIALYAFVHGYPHHHGTVFIATITPLWIAWPTVKEQSEFAQLDLWMTRGMIGLLLCLCAVNILDAEVAIHREYLYPYSGARNAADYLKEVGADRGPMFGFLFGVNAVQAYFDHNLFSNMSSSYYHNGLPLEGTSVSYEELRRVKPPYVISYSSAPQMMMDTGIPLFVAEGYELVHFSDGYYLYKRGVYQRETYFILKRATASAGAPGDQHE